MVYCELGSLAVNRRQGFDNRTHTHVGAMSVAGLLRAPLCLLLLCEPDMNMPCDTAANELAEVIFTDVSSGYQNRSNFSVVGAKDFPLAGLGIHARVLPALLFLTENTHHVEALGARSQALWQNRIASFVRDGLDGTLVPHVRSATRSSSPRPAWSNWPRESTAATLETDIVAAGMCGLLLVYDSTLEEAQQLPPLTTAAQPALPATLRWRALSANLAARVAQRVGGESATAAAAGAADLVLLQLDLALNDVPPIPGLAAAIKGTGLPSYVRLSPQSQRREDAAPASPGGSSDDTPAAAPAEPSLRVSAVPAHRVRDAAALLHWALAHARKCDTMRSTAAAAVSSTGQSRPLSLDAVPAEEPTSRLESFASNGVPLLSTGIRKQQQMRFKSQLRLQLAEIAKEHSQLHSRFAAAVAAIAASDIAEEVEDLPTSECLATLEWAQDNDAALQAMLRRAMATTDEQHESARGLLNHARSRVSAARSALEDLELELARRQRRRSRRDSQVQPVERIGAD